MTEEQRRVKEIQVVRIRGGEVVHTVDCHGKSERHAERVKRGMLINMNHEEYFTRMVYADEGNEG